jgi:hypothetical protein
MVCCAFCRGRVGVILTNCGQIPSFNREFCESRLLVDHRLRGVGVTAWLILISASCPTNTDSVCNCEKFNGSWGDRKEVATCSDNEKNCDPKGNS